MEGSLNFNEFHLYLMNYEQYGSLLTEGESI